MDARRRSQEIFAMTENYNHPYIETEDFGAAIVRFKNGSIGIIEGTANVYQGIWKRPSRFSVKRELSYWAGWP